MCKHGRRYFIHFSSRYLLYCVALGTIRENHSLECIYTHISSLREENSTGTYKGTAQRGVIVQGYSLLRKISGNSGKFMPELRIYRLCTLKGNNYMPRKMSSASSRLKRQPTKADNY